MFRYRSDSTTAAIRVAIYTLLLLRQLAGKGKISAGREIQE